jgi:hypothetical protein
VIVYDGLLTYEFCHGPGSGKAGKLLQFPSKGDAFVWLGRLWARDADFVRTIRNLVAPHLPAECSRLSDYQLMEQAAWLLYSGRLGLIRHDQPQRDGLPAAPALTSNRPIPPAKAASVPPSAQPVETDPPTFGPINVSAQAAALVAAASSGAPFCPE